MPWDREIARTTSCEKQSVSPTQFFFQIILSENYFWAISKDMHLGQFCSNVVVLLPQHQIPPKVGSAIDPTYKCDPHHRSLTSRSTYRSRSTGSRSSVIPKERSCDDHDQVRSRSKGSRSSRDHVQCDQLRSRSSQIPKNDHDQDRDHDRVKIN